MRRETLTTRRSAGGRVGVMWYKKRQFYMTRENIDPKIKAISIHRPRPIGVSIRL